MERFSGGYEEGPSAIEEIDRLDLMAELSRAKAIMAHECAAVEINQDPALQAMLGRLIEAGPNMNPAMSAHLRMMVALRIGPLQKLGIQAQADAEFFEIARYEVERELNELSGLEDQLSDLPDAWDIALEDLLKLYEDDE